MLFKCFIHVFYEFYKYYLLIYVKSHFLIAVGFETTIKMTDI